MVGGVWAIQKGSGADGNVYKGVALTVRRLLPRFHAGESDGEWRTHKGRARPSLRLNQFQEPPDEASLRGALRLSAASLLDNLLREKPPPRPYVAEEVAVWGICHD
jgi:hypothetical protein